MAVGAIQPGSLLTPSLRLTRAFGAGGMGSVWLADHLALHTQVVVKFMSGELSSDADAVARFGREASAAAQVKSPHVVQMLDHGITAGGLPYIIMELLEGRELSKHLDDHGVLPPEEVAAIVTQMCKALRRAHERQIVHRDIKPDNIFMCDVGGGELFIKLLDFGIAKSAQARLSGGSGTRTGAMIGTPYYMSPEQLVGAKEIDHRTDLWSLAVVAFQALTGHLPFVGETIAGLALAIHGAPPLPSQHNRALSPEIDAWFARACAREPAARYPTATEMAAALEDAVRGSARHAVVQRAGPDASQRTVALPPAAASAPNLSPPGSIATNMPPASAPNMSPPVGTSPPGFGAPLALPASTHSGFGATLQPATAKRPVFFALGAALLGVGLIVVTSIGFVSTRGSQSDHPPERAASATATAAPTTVQVAEPPAPPSSPVAMTPFAAPSGPAMPADDAGQRVPSPPVLAAPGQAAATPVRLPAPVLSAAARPSAPKSSPLPATKDFDRQ